MWFNVHTDRESPTRYNESITLEIMHNRVVYLSNKSQLSALLPIKPTTIPTIHSFVVQCRVELECVVFVNEEIKLCGVCSLLARRGRTSA